MASATVQLNQQALAQVRSGDTGGVQRLHHADGFLDVLDGVRALGGHFLGGRKQITVFIQVADDAIRRIAHLFAQGQQRELRMQVVGQSDRRGKEGFKRGLFDVFRGGAFVAWIEIIVEIRTEVDFIERVGRRGRFGSFGTGGDGRRFGCGNRGGAGLSRHLTGFSRQMDGGGIGDVRAFNGIAQIYFRGTRGDIQDRLIRWIAHALGFEQWLQFLRRELFAAFSGFFENRVLGDLRLNHVLKLQTVQLQQADHLHQSRCQDLLLLNPHLQSGGEGAHVSPSILSPDGAKCGVPSHLNWNRRLKSVT